MKIASIVLPIPLIQTFEYLIPKNLHVKIGDRVIVELKKKRVIGIIVSINKFNLMKIEKIKSILEVIDNRPLFKKNLWDFLLWTINYYHYSPGKFLFTIIPKYFLLKGKNSKVNVPNKHYKINSKINECAKIKKIPKTSKFFEIQTFNYIKKANLRKELNFKLLNTNTFSINLYMEHIILDKKFIVVSIILRIFKQGKQVLILVPNIHMIPKISNFMKEIFNISILVLHAKVTEKERKKIWLEVEQRNTLLVIGTKLSLFIPFACLGMIIMEDENSKLYKQIQGMPFHTRKLVVHLAEKENIPVILISNTPSIDTLYNIKKKRYKFLIRNNKISTYKSLINKTLVNIKHDTLYNGFSKITISKIKKYIYLKRDIMIFTVNKEEYSLFSCKQCNWIAICQLCNYKYKVHKNDKNEIFYFCSKCESKITQCIICYSKKFICVELGFKRIKTFLSTLFPQANIIHLQNNKKDRNDKKYRYNVKYKANIFLTSQNLSYYNFNPCIYLLVIIDIDKIFFSRNFIISEEFSQNYNKIINIMEYNKINGEVVLQTNYPENKFFEILFNKRYIDLANYMIKERQQSSLPPFINHALLCTSHCNIQNILFLKKVSSIIIYYTSNDIKFSILGPYKFKYLKNTKNLCLYLLLAHESKNSLHRIIDYIISRINTLNKIYKVKWFIDIDPINY